MAYDGPRGVAFIADIHPHLQCETVISAICKNELP